MIDTWENQVSVMKIPISKYFIKIKVKLKKANLGQIYLKLLFGTRDSPGRTDPPNPSLLGA